MTFNKLKEYHKAIIDFDKSIELDKEHKNSYELRGVAKYEIDDFQGALSDFHIYYELNPNNFDVYILFGKTYYKLKLYDIALENLNKCISSNDNQESFAEAYYYSGLCKLELGEKEDACLDFSIARDKGSKEADKKMEEVCNK